MEEPAVFQKSTIAGFEILRAKRPVPYDQGLSLQRALAGERAAGTRPDTLVLLEHEPVITLGKNADPKGVTAPDKLLQKLGITIHRVERGGQATCHCPGQAVLYPILGLKDMKLGVRKYVHLLEEVMIRASDRAGVPARRMAGRPGIYCDEGKIGAIGVAVTRGVTLHGLALNVCPDLNYFNFIIPCGVTGIPPASLKSAGGREMGVGEAHDLLIEAWISVFGRALPPCP